MIKYINKKPRLSVVIALFTSIALIVFSIGFNIAYGRGGTSTRSCPTGYTLSSGGTCICQTRTSCNRCGQCNTCPRAYQTWSGGRYGGTTCVSPTCAAPAVEGPKPFECNNMDVTFIERLPQYTINGLEASITTRGKYTVKGMTTNGSHSCATIKKAIEDYINPPATSSNPSQPTNTTPHYNTCAYPSSVREEKLERVSWSFNNMTTVKDCGNVKGVSSECNDASRNYGAYPGFTTIGATFNPYIFFTRHRTILQNSAPDQYRWGGLRSYGISSSNEKPGPYPVTKFYNTYNYATLKLALNYEMRYSSLGQGSPCWSPFPFFRECHRVHYYTYTPSVKQPNIKVDSYNIKHRDRNQLIYRNSPIRKSWEIENANSGTCSISTKDSSGSDITPLSKPNINIDFNKGQQSIDFLPIDGATGQYLENVDTNSNFTVGYDPNRISPGQYRSILTCNLSINCSAGINRDSDDCKRTYPPNPYTNPISVSLSQDFTIYDDVKVSLSAKASPAIVSRKSVKTKIIATSENAKAGDIHKYKLAKIPQGYRVLSPVESVQTADASGKSTVSWDVEVFFDPKTNISLAEIGKSEFVVEMIDEPYDNLYTAKASVIYLGTRGVTEVSP